jgi:radical SAM protein with 4Fe4S-binding SPASM domain
MAERLVKSGHNFLEFSLDSTDPEVYETIRVGAKLEKVLNNLRILQETKKKFNSRFPEITVHSVLMKYTLPHFPKLVRDLRGMGISYVSFAYMLTDGADLSFRLPDNTTLGENSVANIKPEIYEKYVKEIYEAAEDKITVFIPPYEKPFLPKKTNEVHTCRELWEEPYVTCDGYVTPCCIKPDQTLFNMGNFNEMTFKDIWFGEAYQKLRYQHLTNQHPAPCRNCQQLYYSLLPSDDANKPVFLKYFLGARAFSTKVKKK